MLDLGERGTETHVRGIHIDMRGAVGVIDRKLHVFPNDLLELNESILTGLCPVIGTARAVHCT